MNAWVWLAVSLVGLWFSVTFVFVGVMHARVLYERDELTLFWRVHILPWAILGVFLDGAFNFTFGWVMFREWPWDTGEILFSGRVQWHVRHSHNWRYALALFWGRQLNAIDPGHIRGMPNA